MSQSRTRRDLVSALAAVKRTWLDRAIEHVLPTVGARRLQARYAMALAGGYTGGSRGKRSLAGWITSKGASADADLLPDLYVLRDRSRDLVRNEPLAAGAINTVVTNVVGTGLMVESQIDRDVLGWTEGQAAEWQRLAEREFNAWAGSPECDVTRTQDFYELQDLVFRSTLESGDVFTLTPRVQRPYCAYGLKLQVIEADRVCNPLGQSDKPELAAGVEMDLYGAPVAYHVAKQHPGSIWRNSTERIRVEAFGAQSGRRNVIHLFERRRPGQTRGAPYLAPVIEPLKQLGRYSEAEISAAVVSAFFAVFVKSTGTGLGPLESASTGIAPGAGGDAAATSWDGKLSPGLVADLGPGEDIVSANPGRPNTAFDPFVQAVLRQVGVALEIPFELLIKHYTASYSAARAAMLDAWRFFRRRRAWLAARWCQPVYETFLEEAIALGRITAPGFFDDPLYRAAYCGALWHGDGPGSIDPMKEVSAAEKRLQLNLTTLKKETAEYDGSDWEKNHAQRAKEVRMQREDGIDQQPSAAQPPADETPPGKDRETDDLEDGKAK